MALNGGRFPERHRGRISVEGDPAFDVGKISLRWRASAGHTHFERDRKEGWLAR
jgi:hypothetical protein